MKSRNRFHLFSFAILRKIFKDVCSNLEVSCNMTHSFQITVDTCLKQVAL